MIIVVVLLLLHFTNEEIDSEGLGVCKGLAKTYNWGLMTNPCSHISLNLSIRKKIWEI